METQDNKLDKYTQRLVNEWRQHGNLLIAVDYDSTISSWPSIENTEDIERTIQLLQVAHQTGAHIVVFTACKSDRFEAIQKHCEEKKIPISGINVSPVETMYGNGQKLYANIFLDDRAGLIQALDMLEEAMYIIRSEKSLKNSEGGHVA